MNEPIVILGGGYAGLAAASKLRQLLPSARCVLIDVKPAFVERIRLHEAAVGRGLNAWPYAPFLARLDVCFVQGRVASLDPNGQSLEVETASGAVVHQRYSRLVYALGSAIESSSTPGAFAHAVPPDSVVSAGRIHQRLQGEMPRVVVVGGGLTGVEMAAELTDASPRVRVTLVTGAALRASERPGGFCERAVGYVRQHFARVGINIEDGRVASVEPNEVVLVDGTRVPFDVCIWACGFSVPKVAARSGLETNSLGQIVTDASLRSVSHPNVVAVGDAASARTEDSGVCRMGCATGLAMARAGARTVAASLGGAAARPFRFVYLFRNVSLGRTDALIQFVDAHDVPRRQIWTGARAAQWKEYINRGTLATIGLTPAQRPPAVPPLRMARQLLRGLSQYA